jgi:CBS domain-containing protein
MQLKEVMTREAAVIRPDATLDEAAELMRARNIGALPVCDGDRLLGMLTDRDMATRATAAGRDPLATRVDQVMTPNVIMGLEDQDVREAAQIMQDQQIRRLVVLDHDHRVVGMVSLDDLAAAGNDPLVGQTLERIVEREQPGR